MDLATSTTLVADAVDEKRDGHAREREHRPEVAHEVADGVGGDQSGDHQVKAPRLRT